MRGTAETNPDEWKSQTRLSLENLHPHIHWRYFTTTPNKEGLSIWGQLTGGGSVDSLLLRVSGKRIDWWEDDETEREQEHLVDKAQKTAVKPYCDMHRNKKVGQHGQRRVNIPWRRCWQCWSSWLIASPWPAASWADLSTTCLKQRPHEV